MSELTKNVTDLQSNIAKAAVKLKLPEKQDKLGVMSAQMQSPDFWSDSAKAQEISKKHSKLEKQIGPWISLQVSVDDIAELVELGSEPVAVFEDFGAFGFHIGNEIEGGVDGAENSGG